MNNFFEICTGNNCFELFYRNNLNISNMVLINKVSNMTIISIFVHYLYNLKLVIINDVLIRMNLKTIIIYKLLQGFLEIRNLLNFGSITSIQQTGLSQNIMS